jgi:transposase
MDKGSLEVLLAQGESVAQIAKRFGRNPSSVSYWMAKYGLVAVNREKHLAKGEIGREVLVEFVEAGMTIAEIAAEAGRSKSTIRH